MIPFLDLGATHRGFKIEIDAAIHRLFGSGLSILSPEVKPFEAERAEYCGAAHAAGLGNGLDAVIYLVARLWDLSFMQTIAWAARSD